MTSSAAPPRGPRDRESFFDAQKRNRRATWRMSGLAVMSALVMGLPLTLVLTPLVYAVALIATQIVNYFFPLPPEVWRDVDGLGRLAARMADYVFNHKPVDTRTLVLGMAAVLGPGIVLSLGLWMVVLGTFRRGGVGGALVSLNARPPDRTDLQELRLLDVVEEMAIAGGLPVPQVMVVAAPGANAAAIGTSPADACVVVSRRLLDDMQREELQGVVGDLVASIGNGDLKIAFTVTSIFETCGLLVALINAPFGPHARGVIWKIIRYRWSRSSSASGTPAEAEAVASILTRNLDVDSSDIDQFFDSTPNKSLLRRVLNVLFFPMFLTNLTIRLTLWVFSSVLLGPCIALVWRTRRYLADASAVELTRDPDGLANALTKLGRDDTGIPGGAWASHLFVVAPSGGTNQGASGLQGVSPLSFHPSLKRRLKRLDRVGAHVNLEASHKVSGGAKVVLAVLWLVIGPPLLVAAGLMLVLIAIMTMFNLTILALWLAVIREVATLVIG
jgi:Zn-dependent protease with chaperone function